MYAYLYLFSHEIYDLPYASTAFFNLCAVHGYVLLFFFSI